MKEFFYGIESLFVEVLFVPFDVLRALELDNWWGANVMSWLFMLIGFVAFFYWMGKLAGYNASGEEDKTITSHSYLG